MKSTIGVYTSQWGAFEIPDDINLEMYDSNEQSWLSKHFKLEHRPVMAIYPLPKNKQFWEWLDAQEVKAGKPTEVTTLDSVV
jgi:hypothetical protein